MLPYTTSNLLRPEDFRVRLTDRPGWVRGTTRLPRQGERILCAAGMGTVTELLGRTGDGSRLVEIGFADAARSPFFAAASNVLLPPASDIEAADAPEAEEAAASVASPVVWLG